MDKKKSDNLISANKELAFQKKEKEKCIAELMIADKKLVFQNEEKEKRAAALSMANKELKKAQDQFRLVVESAPYSMVLINNDGFIILVNNKTEKLFGYERKELVGNTLEILLPERFRKHHPDLRNMFFKKLETRSMGAGRDLFGMKKNGIEVQVEIGLNPIETAQGNMVLASIIDITERKIQEANLKQQNKELAFQNEEKEKRAAELIIANKELAFQNGEKEKRAAEKEKRAEELIIANKELVFQNEEKEKRAAELIILTGVLKAQKEELRRANEELHEKAQLLQQQEKKMIRINDDLLRLNQHLEKRVFERTCELENLNHELKDLSISKDKFLSVISHDLRNPLTALLLASDELNSHSENNTFDPIEPFIKIIHRTSHNILLQLNELVNWAKMQQEKTTLNAERIHLVSAVDQSFELLQYNATQKNIFFENKVPLDIYVKADALMLRSILQNLVTNSIKYSLQGGLVIVTAQRIDKLAEICIIDSGIGMAANTRENLFAKIKSASVSGTNNEKGSGLGLILVKDFVAQHGGTLRVESEIEKGTCIFFTIPEY